MQRLLEVNRIIAASPLLNFTSCVLKGLGRICRQAYLVNPAAKAFNHIFVGGSPHSPTTLCHWRRLSIQLAA